MSQQIQGSLWGRFAGRQPAQPKRPATHQTVKPVAVMPTHRALTANDTLYTLDSQGRRQYVPLTVDGGVRMAGRCWCHCGDMDGVLLVAWGERDDVWAPMRWRVLADGAVMLTEGGQAA